VLTSDDASHELWWLRADGSERTSYAVGDPSNSNKELIVDGAYVVMHFNEAGKGFIQSFNKAGPEFGRSGLANVSTVVYVDRYYLWHGLWDDAASARFLRSQRLDFEL
jgi:hypothetical protein